MISKQKQKGFTLIELLVVIAIIGLLASVVIASLSSARSKGRDSKRIGDIKQLMTALEMYYNANGQYPASGGATVPNAGWSNSSDASWNTLQTALAAFMPTLPRDPVNTPNNWAGTGYTYSYFSLGYGCQQQWYMLVFRIDNANMASSPGVRACDGTFFNYGGTITIGQGK